MDDAGWLAEAVRLAAEAPPSKDAFSVGAVVVSGGRRIGRGYSRQTAPHDHAEEVALRQAAGEWSGELTVTVYTSMEPCGRRSSRPLTCAELIIRSGIQRVVYAMAEPDTFVVPEGVDILRRAGVEVVQLPELADAASRVNDHLRRSA